LRHKKKGLMNQALFGLVCKRLSFFAY
jgi:hypothetical protein